MQKAPEILESVTVDLTVSSEIPHTENIRPKIIPNKTCSMTPCVMYTRVSSEEQAKVGFSIPYQREQLEKYAVQKNLDIVERYEDVHTAKQEGRPGFDAMLDFLATHQEVQDVIVHRIDRLTRNLYQYGLLVEKMGIHVNSVVEPAEDSASGRLQHGLSAVVAKYHSDNLKYEVKKGLSQCFEEGRCVTRAPVGYKNVSRTRTEKSKVIVDRKLAPIVQHMFERYATGKVSLRALALEVNDLGLHTALGNPISPEQTKKLLSHPFYAGKVRYQGQVRPGIHVPLVSEKLFAKVQSVFLRRSVATRDIGGKFFLLRGLLYCGTCSQKLTAEEHVKGSYYRCIPVIGSETCKEPYVPVDVLNTQVEALLELVEMAKDERTERLEVLRAAQADHEGRRTKEGPKLLKRKEQIVAKKLRLAEAYAEHKIEDTEFAALRRECQAELVEIQRQLDVLDRNVVEDIRDQESALEMACELSKFYASCQTDEDKKDFLKRLFKKVVVNDKQVTGIEYNQPFDLLLSDELVKAGSKRSLERQS